MKDFPGTPRTFFVFSFFGENFLKKVFPIPLSKTSDAANCRLRGKMCILHPGSPFLRLCGCFCFPQSTDNKVLVKLLQKLAVSKGRAFGSEQCCFLPVCRSVSPFARAFFGSFFAPPAAKKRTKQTFSFYFAGARGVSGRRLSFAMKKGRDFLVPFSHYLTLQGIVCYTVFYFRVVNK